MMQKLIAEFLGTALLVYVILAIGEPLAIGAALAVGILLFGRLSGGHYNPAVSAVMASKGMISHMDLGLYVLAQLLGGMLAYQVHIRV